MKEIESSVDKDLPNGTVFEKKQRTYLYLAELADMFGNPWMANKLQKLARTKKKKISYKNKVSS
jgi:hypothetical protein